MELHTQQDNLLLRANPDNFGLTTSQDDFRLNSPETFDHGIELITLWSTAYLTDPQGNRLTDASGNYLIIYGADALYSVILHALPDDFQLNAT